MSDTHTHSHSLTYCTSHADTGIVTILVFSLASCSSSSSGRGSYCRRYSRRVTSVTMNISRIKSCWFITVETERWRKNVCELEETSRSHSSCCVSNWLQGWIYSLLMEQINTCMNGLVVLTHCILWLGRRRAERRRWFRSKPRCWWWLVAAGSGSAPATNTHKNPLFNLTNRTLENPYDSPITWHLISLLTASHIYEPCWLLSTMKCVNSCFCVFKVSLVPYLVHGVLGDDLECPQGHPQVHKGDGYRPQGYDCQDAHKWVDPYSSSCNGQLKHGHTHKHTHRRVGKLAKSTTKIS